MTVANELLMLCVSSSLLSLFLMLVAINASTLLKRAVELMK